MKVTLVGSNPPPSRAVMTLIIYIMYVAVGLLAARPQGVVSGSKHKGFHRHYTKNVKTLGGDLQSVNFEHSRTWSSINWRSFSDEDEGSQVGLKASKTVKIEETFCPSRVSSE